MEVSLEGVRVDCYQVDTVAGVWRTCVTPLWVSQRDYSKLENVSPT